MKNKNTSDSLKNVNDNFLKNILFMISYSWKTSKNIFFFSFFKVIIDSVSPFLSLLFPKLILDELTLEKRMNVVVKYIVLMLFVHLLISLIQKVWTYAYVICTHDTMLNSEIGFKSLYADMDYANLEDGSVDEKIWFVREGFNVEDFVEVKIGGFFTAILQLIGYVYIISSLNYLISIILLLIIVFRTLMVRYRNKWNIEYSKRTTRHQRLFSYFFMLMTGKEYAQDIRMHEASQYIKKKYQAAAKDYIAVYNKKQKKDLLLELFGGVTEVFQTIVMYGYSAIKVATGDITIGSFTVYIGAVSGFISSVSNLINIIQSFMITSKYVAAYKEIKPLSVPFYEGNNKQPAPSGFNEIVFDHVWFKYRGSSEYALKNVNLTIKRGERLSIVGYNGAGKSTLIKLICKIYCPSKGRILIDGKDINDIEHSTYVDMISVVFQDYALFPVSIKDNVGLNYNKDEKEVLYALEKSQLLDKIKQLPNGIDTEYSREFDSDGAELSGGEKQKLASARAYCKNTPIVILDEPTASYDPLSEDELYKRFDSIIGSRTAIYISHRLASVKFCDYIAVFENGELVEYGTHSELINKRGLYFNMYDKQAEYYRED